MLAVLLAPAAKPVVDVSPHMSVATGVLWLAFACLIGFFVVRPELWRRLWLERVLTWVRRGACAVKGHDMRRAFEPDRLSLRCAECGMNTPGWRLDVRFPPVPALRARVGERRGPLVEAPQPQASRRPHRGKAA